MVYTFWIIGRTLSPLQVPWLNFPHRPSGVPKLAKLIEVIFHPCSQISLTSGMGLIWEFSFQESTGAGSDSDICAHTSWPVLVKIEILEGSPPSSSWRTSKFSPGCTQERGIWYLKDSLLKNTKIIYMCIYMFVMLLPDNLHMYY